MKKRAIIVLCLALVLTLIGCGNNAQSSDEHNAEYEEGYTAGYEAGYHDGEEQATGNEKHFAQFSGSLKLKPGADQSGSDEYTACDLMTAVGKISEETLTFEFEH